MTDHNDDDFSRKTRSRSNSLSTESGASILDFSKPFTVDTPGCYRLSSAESGCTISLFHDVLSKHHCELLISEIESQGTLQQYTSIHRNQNHLLPRLSAWYGPVDYAYSGVVMKGHTVTDCPRVVSAFQNMAANILEPNNIAQSADCFLVNQYRNGRDSCGEHSDDEPEVDRFSPIITLSLGQQRFMLIREKGNPGNAVSVKLQPGSVLVMNGENFQGKYTHQIPKDNVCSQARTSVTFRTCNTGFLSARNALSSPLVSLSIPPASALKSHILTSSPSVQENRRRQSLGLSISGVKFDQSSDVSSPTQSAPSSPAPSNSSIGSTKNPTEDAFFPPLSLEAMTEAIDLIKDKSVKLELSRHGQSASGTALDCRKRLKKVVKAGYQRLASNLLLPRSQPQPNAVEPDFITNAIETLEKSIVDLQAKISAQNSVLQTLALCNDSSKSKPSVPSDISKELNSFDKRLEKIEDLISSIKEEQTESANLFAKLESNVGKIQSDTTETKERVKSASTVPSNTQRGNRKPKVPINAQRNQESSRTNPRPTHAKPKKKILLLHDSQLNEFNPDSFSKAFTVEKFKAGSYTDLLNKHLREVIGKPEVDSYVLQLGVNDYRYQSTETSLKKAVEDCNSCISKLLSSSSAKLVVVLPTPTPGGPISSRTEEFVRAVTEFITQKRQSDGTWRRLFTVNNLGSFNRALQRLESSEDSPNPLKSDKLHVSQYGLKKLCLNIKYGIYRAFSMKPPRKQASVEPES
ncbi:hypothetical protein ACHWQZ_G009106 [Mnemiopsis leidyi]